MYSFEPSEEQQMLIDVARRFAQNDLRPAAHEAEEHRGFDPGLIEKGWELGVLQASVPDEYGGLANAQHLQVSWPLKNWPGEIWPAHWRSWHLLSSSHRSYWRELTLKKSSISHRWLRLNGSHLPLQWWNTGTILIPTN